MTYSDQSWHNPDAALCKDCGHVLVEVHALIHIASGNAGDAYQIGPCALMSCDCRVGVL